MLLAPVEPVDADVRIAIAGPPASSTALADLTWLNSADVLSAFGLAPGAPLRGLAELACRVPARRFARQMLAFDDLVGKAGLRAGGAWICEQFTEGLELRGAPPPANGPLLIVANHPGLVDAAALFAAIPRADLRVLAITRPFLRALPNIAAHLIAVGDSPASRTTALRSAARHLRGGGALLTFPAGQIEPDPLRLPGASASLAGWSASVDLLVRLAGAPPLLPMIVGGVLAPAALEHPLLRLRRTPAERQWLAAILQMLLPRLRRTRVRVQIGAPLQAVKADASVLVVAEARRLIDAVVRP